MKTLSTIISAIPGKIISLSLSLSLLIMLFCANSAFAQTVFEDWVQGIGSQNYFLKSIVKTDANRNVYQAGATLSSTGDYDVIVSKYNSSGQEIWTKTYDVAGYDDAAIDLYLDNNNNVYLAGTTFNPANSGYQVLVLKYSSSGTFLWDDVYSYPNSLYNLATSITGIGNNIYIGGATYNLSSQADYLALSYSNTGSIIWNYSWNNQGYNDIITKIYPSGNTISLAGGSQIAIDKWQYAIVNVDAGNGSFQYQKITGGSGDGMDRITDLTRDNSGNIYVTGAAQNVGTGYDFRTIKLDTDLNIVWSVNYNSSGSFNDVANALAVDPSGNVYVTGYSESADNGTNYTTLKYNSSGSQLWAASYNGKANAADSAKAIVLDVSNQPIITGVSENTGNEDFHTIKYSTTGTEIWNITYNGVSNGNDNPFDIAIDSAGDVVVAGQSEIGGSFRYASVKYIERDIINPPDEEMIPSSGYFTENNGQLVKTNGQLASEVKFIGGADYPKVYVQDDKLSYVFHVADSLSNDTVHRIDMVFNERKKNPKMRALDKMDFYQNYYLPTVADGKRERVESFKKLISLDVWDDIDLMISHNNKGLKYYLICKPGFSPADLGWKYIGANSVSVNSSGELVLASSIGSVIMPKGEAYEVNSSGTRIDKSWQPTFTASGSDVSLGIGSFNALNTLVIEIDKGVVQGTAGVTSIGNLLWSTYYGGEGGTNFNDIKIDDSGSIFITGSITNASFPLTPDLIVFSDYNSWVDAVVFKLNSNLVPKYATYFGGSQNDSPQAIAVTSNELIYIAGSTTSTDMIIEQYGNSYNDDVNDQYVPSIGNEAFIASFKAGELMWSTYYGEEFNEQIWDIALDEYNNLYCVGNRSVNTENFYRAGAFNQSQGEGMILMFDYNFQRIWATAYNATDLRSVATDSDNRIYIAGKNEEINAPILNADGDFPNTMQYNGESDGYVLAANQNGQLMYAFNIGGNCKTILLSIETDNNNNVYVAGINYTYPANSCNNNYNLPVSGGFTPSNSPNDWGGEVYVLKLGNYVNGNANILKCGYFGGGGLDGLWGITQLNTDLAVNPTDGSFVLTAISMSNTTNFSPNIPAPNQACGSCYDEPNSGLSDVAIAYFDTDFHLQWSTYFGGNKIERPTAVTIDPDLNRLYLIGKEVTNNLDPDVTVFFPTVEYNTTLGSNDYFQLSPVDQSTLTSPSFAALFDLNFTLTSDFTSSKEKKDILIYPNPTENNVVITTSFFDPWDYELFDSLGRKVGSGVGKQNFLSIDLSKYNTGIYVIKLYYNGKSHTSKIVKL